jgi:hypothetical protein
MNAADQNDRKKLSREATAPRSEPEIIPPYRDTVPGDGAAKFSMRAGQRVYVWRPGPFAGFLAILLIGSAVIVAFAIILGLAALSLPVIVALAVVLAVGRLLRNRYL